MSRAERRRAQKCEQKAKTATYNLTRAQLDALVREKISGLIFGGYIVLSVINAAMWMDDSMRWGGRDDS